MVSSINHFFSALKSSQSGTTFPGHCPCPRLKGLKGLFVALHNVHVSHANCKSGRTPSALFLFPCRVTLLIVLLYSRPGHKSDLLALFGRGIAVRLPPLLPRKNKLVCWSIMSWGFDLIEDALNDNPQKKR